MEANPEILDDPWFKREGERLQRRLRDSAGRSWLWVTADMSQIEPCIMAFYAMLAGDITLVESYRQRRDIYRTLAAIALGIPYDEIGEDSKERSAAKVLVLALAYGASPEGLAKHKLIRKLNPTVEKVREWLQRLFETAPGLRPIWWLYGLLGLRRGEGLGVRWSDEEDRSSTPAVFFGIRKRSQIPPPSTDSALFRPRGCQLGCQNCPLTLLGVL
ncbi:MAG: hypothetical protein HGA45_33670 [Chloroflexales bacterium]|nr:hypothetical protein [Chloroflexales bacterium]